MPPFPHFSLDDAMHAAVYLTRHDVTVFDTAVYDRM